ncbi:MAG: hypothetical protein CL916_04510 [Deltaproteobacteria bacterium]|nr:hypothetical protein [Deltaproteobacteria bacterium]
MKAENKTEKRQRAKKLVRQYQLSMQLAFAVVNNECSLHEAIVQSREDLEFELLVQKHDLSTREVSSLKNKEMSLHDVLVQKNTKNHIDETDSFPVLTRGLSGFFWRHHGERLQGEIITETQYDLELLTAEGSLDIPKLHIKACSAEKVEPIDDGANDQAPILRVEDRFRISNKQLYRFLLEKTPVRVSLLGGLVFEGVLDRVGRYECTLCVSEQDSVVLLRHAFALVEEVS